MCLAGAVHRALDRTLTDLVTRNFDEQLGYMLTAMVRITLERQNETTLVAFEKAIMRCPDVVTCHLMSGSDDYLVQVQARDMEDYERIHKQHLSRLPGVMRLSSSFAMRSIVKRTISPSALAE